MLADKYFVFVANKNSYLYIVIVLIEYKTSAFRFEQQEIFGSSTHNYEIQIIHRFRSD